MRNVTAIRFKFKLEYFLFFFPLSSKTLTFLVFQRALQEQRPLRTFRTEFNIYENSSCEERYTTTTTHYTQSQ